MRWKTPSKIPVVASLIISVSSVNVSAMQDGDAEVYLQNHGVDNNRFNASRDWEGVWTKYSSR